MTKNQALKTFRSDILPSIRRLRDGRPDMPALREAWGIYTDSLCKDGRITMRQYETWASPFDK